MPSGSSRSSNKPKPADVAAETKKYYTPMIRKMFPDTPVHSWLYTQPLVQITFQERPTDLSPPEFFVQTGDPVDTALGWQVETGFRIPVVCAANDKRPGGDWETGAHGYEEKFCRRSTLAACLANPGPDSHFEENYPIPGTGGIYSPAVTVFRGPHDRYDKLPQEQWAGLPVCSVPPTRWPKLTQNGTKYSFADEREMIKDKLRGALRICAFQECSSVVIGDFGLGNGSRNPPRELAELWRDVFLYDPDLRGRFRYVAFVFEDERQSTTQLILDDIAKKNKSGGSGSGSGGSSSKGKSKSTSSSSGSSLASSNSPTDINIFREVFHSDEIQRVLGQPDSRYGLNNLLSQ